MADRQLQEENSSAVVIPEALEQGKISGRWQSVNSLVVHAMNWRKLGPSSSTGLSSPVTIKELRWDSDTQNSIYRKLINETHGIFLNLQEAATADDKLPKSTRIKFSHHYRSVMQSCIIELQQKLGKEDNGAIEEMKYQLELLSIMEMFWHLCEILILDTQPGGYCLHQLLNWVKWHFTQADRLAHKVMSADDPFSHPDYWNTIFGYILKGKSSEVVDLLTHHPERAQGRYDPFASLEELLRKMPIFQVYMGQSSQDFLLKWNKWQQDCRTRLDSGEFSNYKELKLICEILSGSDAALERNRDLCQSWYEMMIAKLLYTDPTIKSYDLHTNTLSSIEAFGGYSQLTPLDEIVLALFNFDVHKMIRKCSDCLPNWWFVAHLTDLLFHCKSLKTHNLSYGADLREFLLLEYSASLMSHQSLWIIATDYLLHCPTYGRGHLEAYIDRLPIENDKKATKIIRICERHGLSDQAHGICKVLAMRSLKAGRLGSALSWCLKSKDAVFASFVSERIFNQYMDTGGFCHLDMIDNLGSTMLLSDKLTFLGKYREFHKLYREAEFKEAGKLLLLLLTSSLAPKRFWLTLLIDALPLLEHNKVIFNSGQTYELTHCLQELENSINSEDYLEGSDKRPKLKVEEEEANDKINLLRLGLSRNLARAILHET